MGIHIKDIYSGTDTHLGILLYIKNNVSIEVELDKINSGGITDVRINSYFQTAPDLQRLQVRISEQKIKIEQLPSDATADTIKLETRKLAELTNAVKSFQKSTLHLAEMLLKIRSRTPRLEQVIGLFEAGRILEADGLLDEEHLLADQANLLVQMTYIQQRRLDLACFSNILRE